MTKQELQAKLSGGNIAVKFEYKQIDTDELGLPIYAIEYKDLTIKNYKLVRLIEALKLCVLEDLDYKEI